MKCPYCKSENIDYTDTDFDDDDADLTFMCLACDREFAALYTFSYFIDDDGEIIETR